MIFYYEWELQEAYEKYKKTLPENTNLLDIENFRRTIYEPILNEMYDENDE